MDIRSCRTTGRHDHTAEEIDFLVSRAEAERERLVRDFVFLHCNPDARYFFKEDHGEWPSNTLEGFTVQVAPRRRRRFREKLGGDALVARRQIDKRFSGEEEAIARSKVITVAEFRQRRWGPLERVRASTLRFIGEYRDGILPPAVDQLFTERVGANWNDLGDGIERNG